VLPSGSTALLNDQCTEQMIKTGPKVMNDLASQNGETKRNIGQPEYYERILTAIIAELSDHSVSFRVLGEKSGNLAVEIMDVLFGPPNFCATAD
jgi:hypothetical protein